MFSLKDLTNRKREEMDEVLTDLKKSLRGQTCKCFVVDGYLIQLRKSLTRHCFESKESNKFIYVETLDVVNIGYQKFLLGECTTEEIPTNGAEFIWKALEKYCNDNGLALRIECVIYPYWFNHLVEKKGFVSELYTLSGIRPMIFAQFNSNAIKVFEKTIQYDSFFNK